jgi:hypothetical protein
MMKKRKLILLLLILMVALTGCMQMDLHITANLDGSGVYEWKFLTNSYVQRYLQQVISLFSSQGYRTKSIRENGNVGFTATKSVKNIADEPPGNVFTTANTTLLVINQGGISDSNRNSHPKLKIDSQFFTTSIVFHMDGNMTKMLPNLGDVYSSYANTLLGKVKMRFLLTLPITPSEHNADKVTSNGKTLIWNLQMGKSNPILVGIKLPTPVVLVVAAANGQTGQIPNFGILTLGWSIFILALLIILIMLIRKFFGRKITPSGGNKIAV